MRDIKIAQNFVLKRIKRIKEEDDRKEEEVMMVKHHRMRTKGYDLIDAQI
jgi:serine/threonine protein kinase HipA of HipAB toxin-antitoxin module